MRVLPLIAVALAGLALSPAGALAGQTTDLAAARAYIAANYALVTTARTHLAESEAAPVAVLHRVQGECPGAAAGSPQDSESTQMSNEVIGAMVLGAARPDLPAMRAFVAATAHLRWSNRRLTAAVAEYAGDIRTLTSLAPPALCADATSWAGSGFRALPASTVRFDERFMPAWVALGELFPQLARYERGEEHAMLARCGQIEMEITNAEARAVERWSDIMDTLVLKP